MAAAAVAAAAAAQPPATHHRQHTHYRCTWETSSLSAFVHKRIGDARQRHHRHTPVANVDVSVEAAAPYGWRKQATGGKCSDAGATLEVCELVFGGKDGKRDTDGALDQN